MDHWLNQILYPKSVDNTTKEKVPEGQVNTNSVKRSKVKHKKDSAKVQNRMAKSSGRN